jgi:acyl carrier protein
VPSGQEDDTFFELGGESISAVRLVSRIEEELDVWIDVGDIFEEDPNLEALIRTVVAKAEEAAAA